MHFPGLGYYYQTLWEQYSFRDSGAIRAHALKPQRSGRLRCEERYHQACWEQGNGSAWRSLSTSWGRTGRRGRQHLPISQTKGLTFSSPQKCRLGLVIQHLIGEISRGCNLPGEFISEELWNNEFVSLVIMWEANCYFSWWSWLGPQLEKCMCLPQADVS